MIYDEFALTRHRGRACSDVIMLYNASFSGFDNGIDKQIEKKKTLACTHPFGHYAVSLFRCTNT